MSVAEAALGLSFFLSRFRGDSVLVALSPGGIRAGAAPVGSSYPTTVIEFQSGIDVITTNAKRIMVDAIYQCKAVGYLNDPQSSTDLYSQIDVNLGGDEGLKHIPIPDGYILSCYRQSQLFYGDVDRTGVQFMHLGGLYRVQIQQR